ncbi:MAG: hypothetical protein KDC26_02740 [Armatimonadetes bacterium]|nr:hypothetical protein [Armatimonadota bacterium]
MSQNEGMDVRLSDYGIDLERGFLPAEDPLIHLPGAFDNYEGLALALPKLLLSGNVRKMISFAPNFPINDLRGDREWQRAFVCLAGLTAVWIWEGDEPNLIVPQSLSLPLIEVAEKLGFEVGFGFDTAIYCNWHRLFMNSGIQGGNLAAIQNFYGGLDEEWFYSTHLEFERWAGLIVSSLPELLEAVKNGNASATVNLLKLVENAFNMMKAALDNAENGCRPETMQIRTGQFLRGADEVIFEDCFEGQPKKWLSWSEQGRISVACLHHIFGEDDYEKPLMVQKHKEFYLRLINEPKLDNFVAVSNDQELRSTFTRLKTSWNEIKCQLETWEKACFDD